MTHQQLSTLAKRAVVVLIALLAVLVYADALNFGYVFDDHLALPRVAQYRWWQFLTGVDRRALTLWSFEISPSPVIQHGINLVLHLVNSGLLYRLVARWSLRPLVRQAALAVFLLHPLQVETVAYVSGRADLFVALGLLIALHGVERSSRYVWLPRWWHWQDWAPLVLGGVAVMGLAKPSGAAGVLALALLHFGRRPQHQGGLWTWIYWIPVTLVTTSYLTIRGVTDLGGWDYQSRVALQVVGVWQWLVQVAVPVGLTADHNLQAVPAAVAEILVVGVAATVWGAWRVWPQSRLIGIWLAATVGWRILLPSPEFWSEGDGYLPMIGVAVGIGVLVDQVFAAEEPADHARAIID